MDLDEKLHFSYSNVEFLKKKLHNENEFLKEDRFYYFYYYFLVADTRLYTLPCRSVRRSVRTVTFLNCERFSHYCSCPSVRD